MTDEDAITITPTVRPRLEFLATAGLFLAIGAVCLWMALTRGREIMDPATQLELGGLEPFKHVLVWMIWGVTGLCGLLVAWSLWAMSAAAGCLRVRIADGVLEWRPYIGRRVRVDLQRLRGVEDKPGKLFVGPHLAVRWGRRRKPLQLMRKWYLPLDYKRIREALLPLVPREADAAS